MKLTTNRFSLSLIVILFALVGQNLSAEPGSTDPKTPCTDQVFNKLIFSYQLGSIETLHRYAGLPRDQDYLKGKKPDPRHLYIISVHDPSPLHPMDPIRDKKFEIQGFPTRQGDWVLRSVMTVPFVPTTEYRFKIENNHCTLIDFTLPDSGGTKSDRVVEPGKTCPLFEGRKAELSKAAGLPRVTAQEASEREQKFLELTRDLPKGCRGEINVRNCLRACNLFYNSSDDASPSGGLTAPQPDAGVALPPQPSP